MSGWPFHTVSLSLNRTGGSVPRIRRQPGKLVPQHKLKDPSTLSIKTVLNEARVVMLQVNHPNVVRVLHVDTGSDVGTGPYVMMEYVEGGTLQEFITQRASNGNQLKLEEALSLMSGIAPWARKP